MVEAKHKVRESKKKTIVDRLKGSALFVLFMILLAIVWIVTFVFWLSNLLSADESYNGLGIVMNPEFYLFVGLGAGMGVFFLVASLIQRRAHGT